MSRKGTLDAFGDSERPGSLPGGRDAANRPRLRWRAVLNDVAFVGLVLAMYVVLILLILSGSSGCTRPAASRPVLPSNGEPTWESYGNNGDRVWRAPPAPEACESEDAELWV